MFTSVIGDVSNGLNVMSGLWCTLTSLMLGIIIAYVYQKQGNYSKNFTVTLAILPMLVSFVIMMVNGNLGTGVAVVGAFSLVRFRSVPGSSREIVAIFFSMAIGLAVGMGFLTFAIFIGIIVSFVSLLLFRSKFADENQHDKELKIILDVAQAYKQATGLDNFPQAAIFILESSYQNKQIAIEKVLTNIDDYIKLIHHSPEQLELDLNRLNASTFGLPQASILTPIIDQLHLKLVDAQQADKEITALLDMLGLSISEKMILTRK
ncbi:MAG: DUF4956 domain-containing protein [Erysipelotrichia bacterium]|nr:DUF4956 domain-containing protein [Erysipelotrichia bacterium]